MRSERQKMTVTARLQMTVGRQFREGNRLGRRISSLARFPKISWVFGMLQTMRKQSAIAEVAYPVRVRKTDVRGISCSNGLATSEGFIPCIPIMVPRT